MALSVHVFHKFHPKFSYLLLFLHWLEPLVTLLIFCGLRNISNTFKGNFVDSCYCAPELQWSQRVSAEQPPGFPPGWPSSLLSVPPAHSPSPHQATEPETQFDELRSSIKGQLLDTSYRCINYLSWWDSKLVQRGVEHGELWDPVTWMAGLEDEVKIVAEETEKPSRVVSRGAVV